MEAKLYVCPMHPDVQSDKPGKCPKCGMKLVLKDSLPSSNQTNPNNYTPLIVVISIILLTTIALTLKDFSLGLFTLSKTVSYFMIGFFLVFSGFKLMDVKGFAEGYSTYDLLAQKWQGYGYLYPFIELIFGLSMILYPSSQLLLLTEIIVMTFSGVGVAIKLLKHEKFQCACLGTFLKVPLTNITLIEDFGMAILAIALLVMR